MWVGYVWFVLRSIALSLIIFWRGIEASKSKKGNAKKETSGKSSLMISIGNCTVREVLMKNRTRVWRNVYNTTSV